MPPTFIMTIKPLVLLSIITLILPGCNNKTPIESCSAPDTQKLISKLIIEKTERQSANKKFDEYGGSSELGVSKIHDSLAQFQIVVKNIRPAKQNNKSNKELCSGLLQVTIPANILADADQKRNIEHETTIAEYAKDFGIQNFSNIFTQEIEYKVQSTREGKVQYVEFKSEGWEYFLDDILTASLSNPVQKEADHIQLNEQNIKKIEPLKTKSEEKAEEQKTLLASEKKETEKLHQALNKEESPKKELSHEKVSKVATKLQTPDAPVKQSHPSFNCNKASMPADIKICESLDLAALDVKNMSVYKKAKAIDGKATKTLLSESIKLKFACGTNVICIEKAYKKSIKSYECVAAGNKNCVNAVTPKKPSKKVS